MWISYFHQIQNKYSIRVSLKNPLIIVMDGRDITKSVNISLLCRNKNSFLDCFEDTIKYFSKRYNCIALYGTDEVSFIFENPMVVIEDLHVDKINRVNDIVALFSQQFFDYFNSSYGKEKVFWHGRCFSINKEKINSYIKFRKRCY